MSSLLIADTSPLIIFARTNKLPLLCSVAKQVVLTTTVKQECVVNPGMPGAATIQRFIDDGLLTVVPDVPEHHDIAKTNLDPGEKTAISFALSLRESPAFQLLLDDVGGRKVAKAHGLNVIGSAGLLVIAKRKELIAEVKPILLEWQQAGYWIHPDIVNAVLVSANEPSPGRKPPRPQ